MTFAGIGMFYHANVLPANDIKSTETLEKYNSTCGTLPDPNVIMKKRGGDIAVWPHKTR